MGANYNNTAGEGWLSLATIRTGTRVCVAGLRVVGASSLAVLAVGPRCGLGAGTRAGLGASATALTAHTPLQPCTPTAIHCKGRHHVTMVTDNHQRCDHNSIFRYTFVNNV